LQRADLIGDQVLDFRRCQARHRAASEAMQVAIAGVGTDADAACFCEFNRAAHDVGIAGMKAAGVIDLGRELDHRRVIAHLPGAKTLAEIAVQIDCLHGACSLSAGANGCQVPASTALTAWLATLASARASMLNSAPSARR